MSSELELTLNSSYSELFKRLAKLNTPLICDGYPTVRLMDPNIVAISENQHCIGRAYTVNSGRDSLSMMEALDDLEPFLSSLNCSDDMVPTIMIIATNNAPYAIAGGIAATVAQAKGYGGIILDGLCRDIQEILDSKIPFYARGKCARSGPKDKIGTVKQKIQCGGVDVEPGEIVFADMDGIVVLNKEEAILAILKGEEKQRKEDIVLKRIKDGARFNQISNIEEHLRNIRAGIPSKLKLIE